MLQGGFRNRYVISSDGEILQELNKGDKVVRANSIESYKRAQLKKYLKNINEDTEIWSVPYFTKINVPELRLTLDMLDAGERIFLLSILPYVGYGDCLLRYDNGKELNFETLIKITKINERKLRGVITSLIDKQIVYKEKYGRNTRYYINPWLFYKGSNINKNLRDKFFGYEIKNLKKRWIKV